MNTSIEAYYEAISDGRISKARAKVLECACKLPENFSQADVCGVLGRVPTDFRRIAPRVRELELMGVLKTTGVKTDPNSGMKVKTYKVTGDPPIKLPKRMPTAELHEKMLKFLLAFGWVYEPSSKILIEQLRQRLRLPREEA